MKDLKKLLSLILALAIVFSAVPAFAQDPKYTGFHQLNKTVEVPEESHSQLKGSLPLTYDSRKGDLLTPVVDQGNYGMCWAIAATTACETSFVLNKNQQPIPLSSLQLAWFLYQPKIDPLKNCNGDNTHTTKTTFGPGDTFLDAGGNDWATMWAVANWTNGAKDEVEDRPLFHLSMDNCEKVENKEMDGSYANAYDIGHVQNVYIIPAGDIEGIKEAVYKYGAVVTSYGVYSSYFNSTYNSYYNPNKGCNHEVTIVGWDDTFSKNHFGGSSGKQPSKNGAFLIKNSYGTDYGDNGYFWLSYDDASFLNNDGNFVYLFEPIENYQYNYQYDGSCGWGEASIPAGTKIAATYTIAGNDFYQRLDAVGVGLASTNVKGTVKVYKNVAVDKITNATPADSVQSFDTSNFGGYEGYYTIKLDTPVVISKNLLGDPDDFFTVVISFDSTKAINIFVDDSFGEDSWIAFTANTTNDKTYYINSSGTVTNFNNYKSSNTTYHQTARIKAFTVGIAGQDVTTKTVTLDYYPTTFGVTKTEEISKPVGSYIQLPNPEYPGWRFLGWYDGYTLYPANSFYKIADDITLGAAWEEIIPSKYTVSINRSSYMFSVFNVADINVNPGTAKKVEYSYSRYGQYTKATRVYEIFKISPMYIRVTGDDDVVHTFYFDGMNAANLAEVAD